MRVMELPLSKIRTSLAYLKGTDPGRRRVPLDLEEPVTVMEVSPGVFELVDGFKRLSSLQRREGGSVMVLRWQGDILKAKAMMFGLNARRKTLSFYEEVVLAADLHREEKLWLIAVGKFWDARRAGYLEESAQAGRNTLHFSPVRHSLPCPKVDQGVGVIHNSCEMSEAYPHDPDNPPFLID
jgi:hypothetical protein